MKNEKRYVYPMKIVKHSENEFTVFSPIKNLKITASAESFSKALEVAQSSVEFTLFDMYEDKEVFPIISEDELLNIENSKKENEFVTYVNTSLEQVLHSFGTQPIKKMISIPQYQNFWLTQNNISLSKFLQEAIEKEILLS